MTKIDVSSDKMSGGVQVFLKSPNTHECVFFFNYETEINQPTSVVVPDKLIGLL